MSYGCEPTRHILVDGGRKSTYPTLKQALADISARGERLELLVLSHIDADHIAGLSTFAEDLSRPVTVAEVWYNRESTAVPLESFGFSDARKFDDAIRVAGWPLNASFGGAPIVAEMPPKAISLPGGMRLTILSPTRKGLQALDRKRMTVERGRRAHQSAAMNDAVESFGVKTSHHRPDVEALLHTKEQLDKEPSNGSSIAFVAEWQGHRVLMAADAHPCVLADSLEALATERRRYRIDLFKVSHHGATANTSRRLVEAMACMRYLLSTNGAHDHPNPESIARILAYSPAGPKDLYFNYNSGNAAIWRDAGLMVQHGYRCFFPKSGGATFIDLVSCDPGEPSPYPDDDAGSGQALERQVTEQAAFNVPVSDPQYGSERHQPGQKPDGD